MDGSYIVKIADFGMSRDVYEKDYYTMHNMNKPLPMKWMAVESLKEGRYTSKSDVVSMSTNRLHDLKLKNKNNLILLTDNM